MTTIKLQCENEKRMTVVSNAFIDYFMPNAKPLYVKVYLYMLRIMGSPNAEVSVSSIADTLDETEGDVLRALAYWENVKLISVLRDKSQAITGITFYNPDEITSGKSDGKPEPPVFEQAAAPVSTADVSAKKSSNGSFTEAAAPAQGNAKNVSKEIIPREKISYTKAQIDRLQDMSEVHDLFERVEDTLGQPLDPNNIELILYLFEQLEMSTELIVYLYSYCIGMNKRTARYIEKVALAWAEKGIKTVDEAKTASADYLSTNRCVMTAFGLRRSLTPAETGYVERWFNTLGFTEELVKEACSRTILRTGKPDFKYADKILETWASSGIKTMTDVARRDTEHGSAGSNVRSFSARVSSDRRKSGSFGAFPQRSYSESDYISMEERLLNRQ